ncbi:MAG TPA: hypothetical protein VKI19_00135 [Acidimicrobiales bacterium]|nr:hypothetical protein [Acidimicrobiales bacterium]
MHNYTFQRSYDDPSRCRPRGIIRTALMWAAIAVLAMVAFSVVAWAFGLVFHLAVLLLKIALVTAVVAFVWRRIGRRHRYPSDV